MCLLPTFLLGATYFLLVEFGVRESIGIADVPPTLRFGGVGLIALFLLVALGCGLSLADRYVGLLRALRRIADGGSIDPGADARNLDVRDPDQQRLVLRVRTLSQQNRAGTQALADLESLQREVAEFRTSLRRAEAGAWVPEADPVGDGGQPPGELAGQATRYWCLLRTGLEQLDAGLRGIERDLAAAEAAHGDRLGGIEQGLEKIERLGTVWSLEMELARKHVPQISGEIGSCFRDFSDAIAQLRQMAEKQGERVGADSGMRTEVARLQRIVAQWLRGELEDKETGHASDPQREESR